MPDQKPTISNNASRKPRRKKWLIAAGVIVGLVILFILLLPSLLCTGPGVQLIVSQINSRIAGKVKIGTLSVGWVSPLSVSHLTLLDPDGTVVIRDAQVKTHLSLLSLLSNWHHLGTINIPVRSIHLATVNGELNLLQAVASRVSKNAAPIPAAQAPAAPAPAASPTSAAKTPTAAAAIPPLSGSINLSIQRFTWVTAGEPPLKASGVQFAAEFNTRSRQASHITFSAAAGLGHTAPAKIKLQMDAIAFGKQGLLPLNQITGSAQVQTQGLQLACLNPILASGGKQLAASGLLKLNADVSVKAKSAINSQVMLDATHVHLHGAALKGDAPRLGHVAVRMKGQFNSTGPAPSYRIEACSLSSSRLGSISVSGSGALQAILALMHGSSQKPAGKASLHVKCDSVISDVIKQFPHLLKAPAGATFSGGRLKLAVNIDTVSSQVKPSGDKGSDHASTLPPVAFQLHCHLLPLIWKLPAHQHSQHAYGSVKVNGVTTGGPVSIDLVAFAGGGAVKASTISLSGQLSPFANQQLRPLPAITGNLALNMSHVYLSYLKRLNLPIKLGGVLHGHLTMVSDRPRQGRISGQMQIDTLSLGGKLLRGDHPVLGNLLMPIDMVWNVEHLNLEQLALQCPAFNISAAGAVNLPRLTNLRSTGGDWGHTNVSVQATINTALFTAAFRHTLRLNHLPLKIKTGRATLQLQLASHGKMSTGKLSLALSPQQCKWKSTSSEIDPLTIHAAVVRQAGRWQVESVNTYQTGLHSAVPIWDIGLQAIPHAAHLSYSLSSDVNLALLTRELGPFAELDGKSVAGDFSTKGSLSDLQSAVPHLAVTLAIQHLIYQSDSKAAPIHIASLTLPLTARLHLSGGKLSSVQGTMALQSPQLIHLTAAATVKTSPMDVQHLTLNLASVHLRPVWNLARTLIPSLPGYQLAGVITDSPVALRYKPGRLRISSLALHLRNMSLSSGIKGAAPFTEPKLDVVLAADLHTGSATRFSISRMALRTGDGMMAVDISKPVIWKNSVRQQQLAAPSVDVSADLNRLQNLLITLGKLPVGSSLAGQLKLKAAVLGNAKLLNVALGSQVHGYQLVLPGNKNLLAPTSLIVKLMGQASLQKKIFTATHTCQIGELAASPSAGTTLTIARESVLAWGPGGIENVHGSLTYNLAHLIALLKPFLPATLSATGSGTMPLVVTGPLTAKPGLLMARRLTIAPTALTITSLNYDGIVLGPGSIGFSESAGHINTTPAAIPANQGTLNLGGYIDLNGNAPAYIYNSSTPLQVADNVQINAPMGASILKFLPLTWGNKGNPSLINVSGVLNMSLKNANLPLASAVLKKSGTAVGTLSVTHLTTNAPFMSQVSALAGPLGGNVRIADSGIRPTDFVLKNGRVSYHDMKLVLASFGLDLSGWVSLANQMNVDLNITGGGLTLPIPLKLTGSTASPQVKLTSHPLKSIGKGIKGQVKGLLHGIFGQ